jgi:putative YphP/YqiW family bacilliredoxin
MELTRIGVEELRDSAAVDQVFGADSDETILLVVNSVCGCAAANARPAVTLSQQSGVKPDRFVTVFAGQDLEATARVREYLPGIPPSSPFIALFKKGVPVFVLERRNIEGRSASAIATDLVGAFASYCDGTANVGAESVTSTGATDPGSDTFRSIL